MPKKTLGNISSRPRRRTFLHAWRKYRGLTQQEAADKIGVSYTTVGRKERGANVDQAYLEGAAAAYGCEVIDILARAPGESQDQIIEGVKSEVVRILEKSIAAARERLQVPLVAEDRQQQSAPEAPLPSSKSPNKPNPLKRP
jgi:transcriptional regulator with XRE-family HTH domain